MTRNPKTSKIRIECEFGDPAKPNCPALLLPANLDGILSDPISKSVGDFAGDDLRKTVKAAAQLYRGRIGVGGSFLTEAHRMRRRGVRTLIHAVICDHPGGFVTLNSVENSIRSALRQAIEAGVTKVAIPGVGIVSGRLEVFSVASTILPIAREHCNRVDIKIIDNNKEFVNAITSLLK